MKKTNILEKPFFTGLFIIGMCAFATLIIILSTDGFFKSKNKRPAISPRDCERVTKTITDNITGKTLIKSRPHVVSNTTDILETFDINLYLVKGEDYVTFDMHVLIMGIITSNATVYIQFSDGSRKTLKNDYGHDYAFLSRIRLEDDDLYTKYINIMRIEDKGRTVEQKFSEFESNDFRNCLQCLISNLSQ